MQRRLAYLATAVGLIVLIFAFELRTWHGRGSWTSDPKGKILLATWLASELWLNPWLFLLGVIATSFAVALFWTGRRRRPAASSG